MRLTEDQYKAMLARQRSANRAQVPDLLAGVEPEQPAVADPFAPEALRSAPQPKSKKRKSAGRRANDSSIEAELELMLRANRIPEAVRQCDWWHPVRKWRLDFFWPDAGLAAEVDGGLYVNGRHNRGAAMEEQYIRDQEAAMLGIRVIRFSPKQVKSGRAVEVIRALLKAPTQEPKP